MNTSTLSFAEAKLIPITDYLSGMGIEPAKVRGHDYWYHSPFRDERTPSFKVNTHLNVWYDHGTGEGGTILDLGARLHQCTLSEFLHKLSSQNHGIASLQRVDVPIRTPENKLEILSVGELTDPHLLHYLKTRGISESIGKKYCKEVDFQIKQKSYKAIGFPNQSGAFELRNSWFKGSSSPKDISYVNNGQDKVSVLEGFIDFLSIHHISHPEIKALSFNSDFLILNSLSLLKRSLPILQSHKEIVLFLDNDGAAKESKQSLSEQGIRFKDAHSIYKEYKDVNEYLQARNREILRHKKRTRFRR